MQHAGMHTAGRRKLTRIAIDSHILCVRAPAKKRVRSNFAIRKRGLGARTHYLAAHDATGAFAIAMLAAGVGNATSVVECAAHYAGKLVWIAKIKNSATHRLPGAVACPHLQPAP